MRCDLLLNNLSGKLLALAGGGGSFDNYGSPFRKRRDVSSQPRTFQGLLCPLR